MAVYTIDRACGLTERAQLLGPPERRAEMVQQLERFPCNACQIESGEIGTIAVPLAVKATTPAR